MNLLILKMNKAEQEASTKRNNRIVGGILAGGALFLILMYVAFATFLKK